MSDEKIAVKLIRRTLLACLIAVAIGDGMTATTSYTYDGAGRLIRVEYGNGRGFAYQYDNAGNLTARTTLAPATPTRRRSVRSASAKPISPSVQGTKTDSRR